MPETKDYVIKSVEARKAYSTDYGEMQPYALELQGVDGFVQLSQKPETPAPEVGTTLHGYTFEQKSAKGSFLKFKKVNEQYQNNNGGGNSSSSSSSADNDYIVKLLEAIVVAVGAEVEIKSKDNILEDIDNEPIDLSEIPFN